MLNTKQTLEDNYPNIAAELLRPLLDFMNICREYFGGDTNKFLVMLAVAVRTTMHRDFAQLSQAELLSGAIPILPGLGANVRSISGRIGVPKETVRRKVAELIEAGWLERESGRLYVTGRAYRQLAPVRDQLQILAIRYYEVLAALKVRAERARAQHRP